VAARTRVPRARATATTLVRSEIFFRATKLMTGRLVTGALETAASEPANGQFEFPRERGPDRGNWKRRVVRARAPRAPGTMPLSYSTQKAKTPPRRAPLSSRPAWGSKVARTNARMWSAEPIDAPAARAKKPSVPRRATTTTTTTTTNKSSSGRKHPTTRKTAHERAEAAAAEARARSPLYRASPSPVKAVNSPKRRPLSAEPTHVRFVDRDDDDDDEFDDASSDPSESDDDEGVDADLAAIFQTLDRDGDGAVNIRELVLALRANPDVAARLGLASRIRQEDGSRDVVESFFQRLDADHDRKLTLDEFSYLAELEAADAAAKKKKETAPTAPPPPPPPAAKKKKRTPPASPVRAETRSSPARKAPVPSRPSPPVRVPFVVDASPPAAAGGGDDDDDDDVLPGTNIRRVSKSKTGAGTHVRFASPVVASVDTPNRRGGSSEVEPSSPFQGGFATPTDDAARGGVGVLALSPETPTSVSAAAKEENVDPDALLVEGGEPRVDIRQLCVAPNGVLYPLTAEYNNAGAGGATPGDDAREDIASAIAFLVKLVRGATKELLGAQVRSIR